MKPSRQTTAVGPHQEFRAVADDGVSAHHTADDGVRLFLEEFLCQAMSEQVAGVDTYPACPWHRPACRLRQSAAAGLQGGQPMHICDCIDILPLEAPGTRDRGNAPYHLEASGLEAGPHLHHHFPGAACGQD